MKASPLAKRIAEDKGIDLASVQGSGPGGRIVKADLEGTSAEGAAPAKAAPAAAPVEPGETPHEIVKLSNMRKTIARRLTEAKQTIPHIYLTVDIQLDALLKLRSELNAGLESRGIKLSVNDLLIKALAAALIEVPECNVSFAGDNLIKYSRADVSVAVSIPGGLITPIVADADGKTVSAIATEMKDLAARAKDGKLQPEEYQGGTASLSNMGMYGIKQFEAVINPPQGMIMAIGAGEKRPYVINDSPADRDRDERDRKLRPPRHRRRRRGEADAGVQAADRKPAGDAGLTTAARIPVIRVTAMPSDTNPYGGVFGGWLMGQMGLACGSFASKHSKGKAILVAANEIKFPGAMAVGDELSVYVELLKQGRTSLRLKADAIAQAARRGRGDAGRGGRVHLRRAGCRRQAAGNLVFRAARIAQALLDRAAYSLRVDAGDRVSAIVGRVEAARAVVAR